MSAAGEAEREAAADRLISAALDALSAADGDAFAGLVTEDVVVKTARSERHGRDAAREWAAKRYDHLDRRYRISALAHHAHGSVVDALVEYVWRGEDEVADTAALKFHFELRNDQIARIELID